MAENKEPTSVFIDAFDKAGKPIFIFSTEGKLRTAEDFAKAIDNYDNNQPTPGFIVHTGKTVTSPKGEVSIVPDTFQGKVRLGFEESVGRFARETVPAAGEAIGGIAGLSPILALAQKAGLLSNQTANAPIQAGKGVGKAVGQYIGEQFDTPGEAGLALATGGISKYLKVPTSDAGQFLKIPFIANILKSGAAGLMGTTAARAITGEELSPGQGIIDFAIPAVGGTAQGIVSHLLTKYLNKGLPEKVAKGIMDTFKERHPNMSFGDDVLDIAFSSQTELSHLTQQMSKGLRESLEDETQGLLGRIYNQVVNKNDKGAFIDRMTVGQQNTVRSGIRGIIKAQNENLNAIENPELFTKTSLAVKERTQELVDTIRGFYPRGKNIGSLELRVESVLNNFNKEVNKFNEGAQVLHYLKQSGAAEGFDFNKFGQLIRGVYNESPGSQLSKVGKILGQGRPLTSMPAQQIKEPPSNWVSKIVDAGYNKLGPVGKALTLKDTGPSLPWQVRQTPMQPLINFGAQEGGQVPSQAVLRSFINQGEQK